MLLIISSGSGPGECERAVYEYFKYLEKEFHKYGVEYEYVKSETGKMSETFRSEVLKIKVNTEL